MKKYALALDLVDDPELRSEYIDHHRKVWPEIKQRILESGILSMEIFNVEDRLFMLIETEDSFSFEEKARRDAADPVVQEWENLMSRYQKQLPGTKAKWVLMDCIFKLTKDT